MDIKLNYIEKGEGIPLVLLHGNGESLEYFVHQIEYFSKHFRVIAVDTRGHGKSPRGTKPFTLEQFAEDLKEFLDEKKFEKINLLGFSDGGNIALLFALKYPDYINKLVLNGADLHPSGVKRSVQIPIILTYGVFSVLAFFKKSWIAKKEMFALMVTQPDIKVAELKKLILPTLVIAGADDMIKQSHTETIHQAIKNSKMCIIKGDHFIANKRHKEFNHNLSCFLEA